MTDYTPEKVADLIAEARSRTYTPSRPAMLVTRLADAIEAVENMRAMTLMFMHHARAERDEARRWAETMQEQKFEWEDKEATVRAERDEALATIADAREVLTHVYPASLGPVGEELVRILSSIPEHPKED